MHKQVFEIPPFTPQKCYFVGTPYSLEMTFFIVILSVAIAKSKNLGLCFLSKLKGIIFIAQEKSEISRLRSKWQERITLLSPTEMQQSCISRLVGVSQNNSNNNTKYLTKKSAENVIFSAVIFCVKYKRL